MPKDALDKHYALREFTILVPAYTLDPILALPIRPIETSLEEKRSILSLKRIAVSLGDYIINDKD
ncbi:hypothetical protein COCCADRAFT_112977 [Bipolaris zeicola 26-R-13]|uniref:Uncharacterized protein n=1 Tax=Cochliobolus carbonum (strain 26-R-13) TaxID=930089 RepID=W6XN60_COCC2|nr:uncharacterized protein COCCADRAFT_112977 [Bipolaris zeicola 26-R-13]EUC26938.1 hypothetical protein COCCADRAFT_112977 [Bipolaris zeicola 26-R-13]